MDVLYVCVLSVRVCLCAFCLCVFVLYFLLFFLFSGIIHLQVRASYVSYAPLTPPFFLCVPKSVIWHTDEPEWFGGDSRVLGCYVCYLVRVVLLLMRISER